MNMNKVGLLGLVVDAIGKEAIPQALAQLHELYKKDRTPKYGTCVNAYVFSHLHGWLLNSSGNGELLKILRNADFVGLDSTLLCRLGKFIGCEQLKTISAEELFLATCAFLDDNKLSLYILGGDEEVNRSLETYLRTFFPKIRLVGTTTPLILTKGSRLEESQERDHFIVEAINIAKPDLLFLQLGHPKQEIWFERVKYMLQVPITIGIGGGIERFLLQLHNLNPEEKSTALFPKRISQFLKHIPDYFKYVGWLLPLSMYNAINHMVAKTFSQKKLPQRRYFFLSSNKSLTVIPFPTLLTPETDTEIAKWLEEAIEQDYIVLDFSNLKYVDAKGIALISETVKWAENLGKKLFIMNVHPDVCFLLKLHGFWNYFQVLEAHNPQEVIYRMSEAGKGPLHYLELYESIYQEKNEVILSFFGDFSVPEGFNLVLQKLAPILQQKACVINLKYCSYIDNKGIGFLLKLHQFQKANNLPFKVIGCDACIAKKLRDTKVNELLHIEG